MVGVKKNKRNLSKEGRAPQSVNGNGVKQNPMIKRLSDLPLGLAQNLYNC